MRRLFVCACSLVATVPALRAQPSTARAEVGVRIGVQSFAASTALEQTGVLGFEMSWPMGRRVDRSLGRGPSFGVGASLDVARPRTNGEQFPLVPVDRGDTTFLMAMAQRVTLLQTALVAEAAIPFAGAQVIGSAGGGVYAIIRNGRFAGNDGTIVHPLARVGLAVDDPLTPRLSVRLQVSATTFLQFDRETLDAGVSDPPLRRIRDATPAPVAASRTPTNLQYALLLRYTPRGR